MTKLWNAVLAAPIIISIPTAVMASGHSKRTGWARIHSGNHHHGTTSRHAHARIHSKGAHRLVRPLAAKVTQITSNCGSRVVSGVRHTRVAGTRKLSLHASGQAADIQGNPGCVYRLLRGWPGGYSVDYARVHHVHISFGGREQGLRFVHGGHRSRYASHHARRFRRG